MLPGVLTGALICTGEPILSTGGQSWGVTVTAVADRSRARGADLGDLTAGVVAGALGTRVENVGDTACRGDNSRVI